MPVGAHIFSYRSDRVLGLYEVLGIKLRSIIYKTSTLPPILSFCPCYKFLSVSLLDFQTLPSFSISVSLGTSCP